MSHSYSSSLSFGLKSQGQQERSQGQQERSQGQQERSQAQQERSQGGKPSRLEVQSPSGQRARGHKEGERAAADKSKDAAAQWCV